MDNQDNQDRTVEELPYRLWGADPQTAAALQRYIDETIHLKNIVQAVAEDIGYCMNALDLRAGQSDGLRRCMDELTRIVEEHTRLTAARHFRFFRPRFPCEIKSLRRAEPQHDMLELVVHIPISEYNASPHSLMPGDEGIYIMMKDV
ncbi:hypothetical protein ACJZ2D_013556 [Fusarium nematophilum]